MIDMMNKTNFIINLSRVLPQFSNINSMSPNSMQHKKIIDYKSLIQKYSFEDLDYSTLNSKI